MPWKVCHAEVALQRAHLRVSACTDRLVSPCHRPPVSSLRPRIGLVGRTMAPSQHQTAPTPRRCRRSKDKKTKQMNVLDFAIWDDLKSFLLCKTLPEGRQKKNRHTQKVMAFSDGRKTQWASKSDRPDRVHGSVRQVCTHAMMQNRDHLCELAHVIDQTIICNTKKAPRTNRNANSI